MKSPRFVLVLTAVNLALVLVAMTQARPPAIAPERAAVVRASMLELVDESGQVRSRLKVEEDGEVVFRLFDRTGTIRVKLGAGEGGSGLLLLDETTEPAIHLVARRAGSASRPKTTSVSLSGADGRQKLIEP